MLSLWALAACGTYASSHYGQPFDAGVANSAPDAPHADAGSDDVAAVADSDETSVPLGPPYPMVLHHGFAGFRNIGPVNYFFEVASTLRALGNTVYEAEVSPFNTPAVRATELAAVVDRALAETGRARVVVIAHSQGGLDARYLVSTLGYGDRVALLVTVATPHRGTYVADAVLGNAPSITLEVATALASVLGNSLADVRTQPELREALAALTPAACADFNRANPDDRRVVYWSWSGRSNGRTGVRACAGGRFANDPSVVDSAQLFMWPTAVLLEQGDPDQHVNDGMVEVFSARWGLWMGCVPADHMDEVGQLVHTGANGAGWNHRDLYRTIALMARNAGF